MPQHTTAEKIRNFLDERQAEPPTTPSSTDKLNEFISRQGEAESLIARQGAAPAGLGIDPLPSRTPAGTVPKATPSQGTGGLGTAIFQPGLRGLELFQKFVTEPVAATATVARAPSALGLAGVPGFGKDFGFDPGQLPGREGFRERFRENVPLGSRILAEAGTDPLNLVPGIGFTKLPGRLSGLARPIARSIPVDPFLRAATPATQRIGETLGTQGTTAAVSRMRLAQTGQRAGPGFAAVPDVAPTRGPSAVRQTFTQEGDEALLFAGGEQNRLDPTRAVREAAEPSITQRQSTRDLPSEIRASQEARTTAFTKGPTGTGGGVPPPARTASAGPPGPDPLVDKVIKSIRGAQRLGPESEELVGRARTERFARGMGAQGGLPATERAGAFFRQQAGPIDRPDITALQIEFGPGEYEGLVERIYSGGRLREGTFDPFTAAEAFKKLFNPVGGTLPQPHELELLERVFGPEFARALLSQRSLGVRAWDNFMSAWNLPRALMATGDLSATLRQAAPLGVNNKRIYKEAFKEQVRAFLSEKAAVEVQDVIESHPRFLEYTKKPGVRDPRKSRRLDLTSFSASGSFARREESFMSKWSQNLPIVRNAERAYVTMLNKLRFEVMDDMVVQAEKNLGRKISEKELDGIASYINYATGRGPLGPAEAAAPILNGLFFAPRFATSRFALPAKVALEAGRGFTGVGGSTNRATSRRMARDMALFVGTGMSVLKLAELAPGVETSADPRSSDFGKIVLGKTRIDIWGGFQQVARLTAQMITGEGVSTTTGETFPLSSEFIFGADREGLEDVNVKAEIPSRGAALTRFLRGKLGPVAGEGVDQFTGEDFLGDEASPGKFTELSRKNPVFENLTPLFVQDVVDAIQEEGLTSGLKAVPSFFGAGAVTYTSDLDKAAETNFGQRFRELDEEEQGIVRDSVRKVRREKQLEKVRKNQP